MPREAIRARQRIDFLPALDSCEVDRLKRPRGPQVIDAVKPLVVDFVALGVHHACTLHGRAVVDDEAQPDPQILLGLLADVFLQRGSGAQYTQFYLAPVNRGCAGRSRRFA
jgi:hypothetical protein